jgi:hypothetical protein
MIVVDKQLMRLSTEASCMCMYAMYIIHKCVPQTTLSVYTHSYIHIHTYIHIKTVSQRAAETSKSCLHTHVHTYIKLLTNHISGGRTTPDVCKCTYAYIHTYRHGRRSTRVMFGHACETPAARYLQRGSLIAENNPDCGK